MVEKFLSSACGIGFAVASGCLVYGTIKHMSQFFEARQYVDFKGLSLDKNTPSLEKAYVSQLLKAMEKLPYASTPSLITKYTDYCARCNRVDASKIGALGEKYVGVYKRMNNKEAFQLFLKEMERSLDTSVQSVRVSKQVVPCRSYVVRER